MTTETLGLLVQLEARIDKFEKGFARANRIQRRSSQSMERRARKSADRIGATYSKMGDGIGAGFKKMLLPLASVAAGRAIAETTKGVARLGDEAKRAGVPLKDFQEWKFVAEQNRIGIDQMVDGLKELNIRADEFVITGKGSGAEAFTRLGFSADELKEKLKNPSELLLEIIGRMKRLNTSARIRVTDELFGGTAGERFVELIDQGEDGLRRTVDRANELGLVLGKDVVTKADEVSRKFDELTTRISTFGKRVAVALADGVTEIADLRAKLDEIFKDEKQGRAVLGDELFDALSKNRDIVDDEIRDLGTLRKSYDQVGNSVRTTSAQLLQASNLARSYGYDEVADDLAQAATDMSGLSSQFQDGSITGEEFADKLNGIQQSADKAFGKLGEADKVDFSIAISEVSRLGGVIQTVIGLANSLKSKLKEAASVGSAISPKDAEHNAEAEADREAFLKKKQLDGFLQSETEQNAKSKERLNIEREILQVRKRAKEAGITLTNAQAEETAKAKVAADALRRKTELDNRGSGRASQQSDFEREVTSIAEEIEILRIEAQELAKARGAQIDHGNAMDLARTKAELLASALRSGLADTPALRSQIDQLATEYNEAGQAAELAADKIADVQAASQRGAESITSVFEGMATGALTAKEAVGKLILEVIKLSLKKRLLKMAENADGFLGNIFGVIGGGYAEGGYTGNGGKYQPAGVVHRGEFVMSKAATKSIGVGNLETLHRAAKSGFAAGGYVGGAAPLRSRPAARSESLGAININAPITVNGSSGTPEQNNDLAKKMARQMEGAMRGVVVDEIRKSMRPGNLMNNRR